MIIVGDGYFLRSVPNKNNGGILEADFKEVWDEKEIVETNEEFRRDPGRDHIGNTCACDLSGGYHAVCF